MFGLVDRWIERKIKKALYKKRSKIITHAMDVFIKEHHPDEKTIVELRGKLEIEADRIYAIADRSILRGRIQRAKYTFWITAIAGSVIVGIIVALTHGTALAFIAPIATAIVSYLLSLSTIPIGYNQRIKGSMDSTIFSFEKSLISTIESKKENTLNKEEREEIAELKKMIQELNDKVDSISKKVDAIYQKQMENNHPTLSPSDDLELKMLQTWKNNLSSFQEVAIKPKKTAEINHSQQERIVTPEKAVVKNPLQQEITAKPEQVSERNNSQQEMTTTPKKITKKKRSHVFSFWHHRHRNQSNDNPSDVNRSQPISSAPSFQPSGN